MASEKTSPRFPWVALVLSFLASGVGHIYCGRIARGFVLYSTRLWLPLLCVIAAFVRPSNGVFFGLIILPAAATLLIFFYSAIDAFAIASQYVWAHAARWNIESLIDTLATYPS